jgi:glycine dehydrogenase subunit 1
MGDDTPDAFVAGVANGWGEVHETLNAPPARALLEANNLVRWIPGDGEEEKELLAALGISSVEELFRDIPASARMKRIGIEAGRTEAEVVERIDQLLAKNTPLGELHSFLGGGLYERYTPAVVDGLIQRSEFYTSYTPYQPEASQGVLQSLFEFQSLWVELTDMEVANASLYDGSTAIGEAMLMARRLSHGHRFLVPSSLFWEKRSVLENYSPRGDVEFVEIPIDPRSGRLDLGFIEREARKECFGVLAEYPDSLGILQEDLPRVKAAIGDVPLIVSADPLALTILEPPGAWGADIVVGEGQSFGIPLSYGGPLLGLMAVRHKDVRMLPGRVAGATVDRQGRRAFTLTLQTREQHIRRSRATSNICTNQTLMALVFLSYATAVGPRGLRRLATSLTEQGHALAGALAKVPGLRVPLFEAPFLWEFAVGLPTEDASSFLRSMRSEGVLAGISLQDPRPGAKKLPFSAYLTSVGERTTEKAIAEHAAAAGRCLAAAKEGHA